MTAENGSKSGNSASGPPDSRRMQSPAIVTIEGRDCPTRDWSAGGFKLIEFDKPLQEGDCFLVHFKPAFTDEMHVEVKTLAEVIWTNDQQQSAGFQFTQLSALEKTILENLAQQIIRREQDGTAAKPESTEPLDPLDALQPKKPKSWLQTVPLRRLGFLTAISIVGGVTLYYVVQLLYQAAAFVQVDTAAIQNPVEQIIATHRGQVVELLVEEGERVEAGSPIVQIYDQQIESFVAEDQIRVFDSLIENAIQALDRLEEQMDLKQAEINLAEAAVETARQRFRQEQNSLENARRISRDQLEAAQAEVDSLAAQRVEIQGILDQNQALVDEGAIAERQVMLARVDLARVEGELRVAQQQAESAQRTLDQINQGQFYNGERFVGELPELETAITAAEVSVERPKQELAALKASYDRHQAELTRLTKQKNLLELHELTQGDQLFRDDTFVTTYHAPIAGKIAKVFISNGSFLNIGHQMMLIQEEIDITQIEAYLTQDQALYLGVDDPVTIISIDLEMEFSGVVVEIDRRGGFFDDVRAKYQLEGTIDNDVFVKIESNTPEAKQLISGTPVEVKFRKRKPFVMPQPQS